MPNRSLESVLAELREEQHLPLVKFVTELSLQPWATTLRFDISRLRLWIARKDAGRLEVMVAYGGEQHPDSVLDVFDISIFEDWAAVETVTRNLQDSVEFIGKWLADANRRLPEADKNRAAAEASIPSLQLGEAWLAGDKHASLLLAGRLGVPILLRLATAGLAACSQAISHSPTEVAEVVRVGSDPALWIEAHRAFDRVRELVLATERRGAKPEDLRYSLLFVAESASRVIYNASLPRDPFDDDAAESLLSALACFLKSAPQLERERIARALKACLDSPE